MPEDLNPYLQPGATVQSTDNSVVAFTHRAIGTETDTIQQIRRLYFAVRDSIRYDPYQIDLSVEGLSARRTLDEGHCNGCAGLNKSQRRIIHDGGLYEAGWILFMYISVQSRCTAVAGREDERPIGTLNKVCITSRLRSDLRFGSW